MKTYTIVFVNFIILGFLIDRHSFLKLNDKKYTSKIRNVNCKH